MIAPGARVAGYTVLERIVGGKSQTAKVADAGGTVRFMKQFSSPKYPTGDARDEDRTARLLKVCESFEQRHRVVMARLRSTRVGGGNLVKPLEFFRDGAAFYKVYPLLEADQSDIIQSRNASDKAIFARTLVLCVRELHVVDIVHGDLKPDNVMVAHMTAGTVAKLIDFDEAYLSGAPPTPRAVGGDPVYYSPELQRYIEGGANESALTVQSDIFALGLLIHRVLTGALPTAVGGAGGSHALRALAGARFDVDHLPFLPGEFNALLPLTLEAKASDRPTIDALAVALGIPHLAPADDDEFGEGRPRSPSRLRTTMNPHHQ